VLILVHHSLNLDSSNNKSNLSISNYWGQQLEWKWSFFFIGNRSVERCSTDDLMPNAPISCLPPSRVDPKVQGLKVIIDCPQPGSSRATYRPPPLSRWSKCGGNDTMMILLRAVRTRYPKKVSRSDLIQRDTGEQDENDSVQMIETGGHERFHLLTFTIYTAVLNISLLYNQSSNQ